MSKYLEKKLLQHITGQSIYTPPGVIYLGLFKDLPTDAGGTEVTGGGYARQEIDWLAVTDSKATNNKLIKFPKATDPWGTIRGVGLFDAQVGGNMLFHGITALPEEVGIGSEYIVYAENLVVVFD